MTLVDRFLLGLVAVLGLLLALSRCSAPVTPQAPRPWALPFPVDTFHTHPSVTPLASPVASPAPTPSPLAIMMGAHQNTHILITRRPIAGASPVPATEDTFDLTVQQDEGATVPIPVMPSAMPVSPQPLNTSLPTKPEVDHTRIGVFMGTIPGLAAVDIQLVRMYPLEPLVDWKLLPPDLARLEASVDLEVNLKQAGLMATAGGKIYGGVGGFGSTDWSYGAMGGVGMRF